MKLGEDIQFIRQDPSAKTVSLQAITFLVDIVHTDNISPKDRTGKWWHPYPGTDIQGLMGKDWSFYVDLF